MPRSSDSTLSSSRVTELLTLSLRPAPAEKAHFGRLYPGSCPFGHDPQLMTIGESRNVDWPVNQELRLAAQLLLHHNRPVHQLHYWRSCTDPSDNLPFHPSFTREQDPKILKLLHLQQEISTNLKWPSHLFTTVMLCLITQKLLNDSQKWKPFDEVWHLPAVTNGTSKGLTPWSYLDKSC